MSQVLIAGRSEPAVNQLQMRLREQSHLRTELRVITNGHADPLYGVEQLPDVLVLVILDHSIVELEALAERPAALRPPLVVVSNTLDTNTMRQAMRAGARECFDLSGETESIVGILESLCAEQRQAQDSDGGQIVTVMNSAGGLGASMIASNLAYLSAEHEGWDVALLDMDLQLAPQCNYFDLKPKNNMLEAIERAEEMDEQAIDAFASVHKSGLHLLSSVPGSEVVARDQYEAGLGRFLEILSNKYQRVVVDLPPYLDALAVATLERSDVIVLVLQQNLTSIRNATRLLDVLRNDLLVDDEHIIQVVNRHNRNATLEISDLRRTLMAKNIASIPNQYRYVVESVDIGVPMLEHAPGSPVTKAMRRIEQLLTGEPERAPRNFIERTFSTLLRS